MDKSTALEKLKRQLDLADQIPRGSPAFHHWHRNTELAIEHIFGSDTRHLKDFRAVSYRPSSYSLTNPNPAFESAFYAGLRAAKAILTSMMDEIEEYWPEQGSAEATPPGPVSRIERICRRFHLVARQLRSRHANRWTLDVGDEYDAQDLMHALLRLDFNDIRPEEWCPSYAGKNARMDFQLKEEQIVLELKKTRRSLSTADIGDQLVVDIARYRGHPDCRRLVCFVYDPEGLIGNPAELERDLSRPDEDLEVQVIVAPQGA